MKKSYRWIFTLAMLLMVLLAMSGCKETKETAQEAPKVLVGWNVDRDFYYDATTKMSLRGRAGDNYRVRFAVDGEQIELFVPTTTMMEYIDSMKFMGLAVDENNVVTQVYKPHEFTGGLAAYEYYVISIDGEKLLCNNASNGRGLPLKLKINENTQVYDVSDSGLLAGRPGSLTVGSRIYAINGLDGYVSHIYVTPPFQIKDVYWNVNRQYNSANKSSTRKRDALGYFNIEFVLNGETMTLRTQSIEVIDKIDGFGGRCMMLEFDENGLISNALHAKYATGGATVASWYHVKRLDKAGQTDDINIVSDGFFAEKLSGSDKGKTVQASFADNCKIYNMSGTGAFMGQITDLRVGDQIHCLSNGDGDVVLVFIVNRPRELDLYYNVDRQWDNNAKASTRRKSSDGYYHFTMSVGGKTVNLKTEDEAIVKTIDSRGAKVVGLELDENVIKAAYAPSGVANANKTIFDYAEVTAVEDGVITATRNGQTFTGTMAEHCLVWDVSSIASNKGEATTVRVGDKVYGLGDNTGVVHNIYVVNRTVNSPVYWNLDRSYNSATKTTKRVPAEDGYYYIKLSKGTETVTFKTKSKALVNKLDSFVAVAITASGDTLTNVYKYDCAKGYSGGGFASWATVKSVSGKTVVAANTKTTYTGTMASGCKIYNVSGGSAVPVTQTSLKSGDKIHGIKNNNGEIVMIFVVTRPVYLDLYYNVQRMWDDTAKVSTRTPDADGWYWFTMSTDAQQVQLKTKNTIVVNTIDERSAKVLGLELKGDEILAAYKPGNVETSKTTVIDFAVVTEIKDGVITATRSGNTITGTLAKDAKIYNVSGTAVQIGEYTTIEVGDTVYGLGTGKNAINYVYVTKRTPKVETKTALCSACGEQVEWSSWDGKSSLSEGHWYLIQSVNQTDAVTIKKDTKVCLDLCGFEVKGAQALDRMLNIYGTLNIMDSGEAGKIITNYANPDGRTGSVFYVQNSKDNGYGALNLYGGTLTSNGNTKQGGIGGVSNVFNMYGGTIIGGTAIKGGSLYLEAAAKVAIYNGVLTGGTADLGADIYGKTGFTVGGAAQIGTAYLESGKSITLDGLTEGASIGVVLQDVYGVVATNAAETDKSFFTMEELVFADGKLMLSAPEVPSDHNHCICGGLGQIGNHTCTEEVINWQVWDGTWVDGGYYYLASDFNVESTIMVSEGKTLNLCLNGFDLIGGAKVTRIFNLYGTLNLCDHADEDGNFAGDVISNYEGDNTQSGRVFYVQNKDGAAMNLFGGNLISNSITNKGGVGGTAKELNIYAGTISGGRALVSGGNIQVDAGVATLYGGKISSGQAPEGGNVYVSAGKLVIKGGQIVEGVAETNGSDVYVKASLILSGAPVVGEVYLPTGKLIEVDGLTDGASVGVVLADTYGNFATGAQEADVNRFLVAEDLQVVYTNGTLSIPSPEVPDEPDEPDVPAPHADHCICAGLGQIGDHTCSQQPPVWEPWTGIWVDGGYYYLTGEYQVTETIKIEEGTTVSLCLNGFDMVGATDVNRIFSIFGILNLCDHKTAEGTYEGDVSCNYDPANNDVKSGGVFYVQNRTDAALNLFGGNLKLTTKLKNGGVGSITAKFNLYDGTLTGTQVSGDGGVLYLEHTNAKVNLYGGTVSGGRATNGGNIYVKYGTLTIDGAEILGGYASNAGGSIRLQSGTTLNLISGKISGGEAKGNGGNIYSLGSIVITGGTVEKGHAASGKIGGNIYASGGTLSVANATITEGSATTGGNIAIKVDGVVITNSVITGGTADSGADIYFEKAGGTLTVTSCGEVNIHCQDGTVEQN